jgi:hypothetical protein
MGIAMCLAGDGAKAKAACLVIAGRLQSTVIEGQHFRMSHLEEQFPVIGIDKRVTNDRLGVVAVKRRVVKEDCVCRLQRVHDVSSTYGVPGDAFEWIINRRKIYGVDI